MNETKVTCPACDGDGEQVTSHRFTCFDCNGTGKVDEADFDRVKVVEDEINRQASRNMWRSGGDYQ